MLTEHNKETHAQVGYLSLIRRNNFLKRYYKREDPRKEKQRKTYDEAIWVKK